MFIGNSNRKQRGEPTMKRCQLLQSSVAAAVATSLPTSQALAAALAAISEVSNNVNAVTGSDAMAWRWIT
jgi:hypothetical protein